MTAATVNSESGPHPWVVVGVDGSADAERAACWASEYVRATGGSLELVCAHSGRVTYGLPPMMASYDTARGAEIAIEKAAAELLLPPERIHRSVVRGSAARILAKRSNSADLVVVGSRGLGGPGRVLLGSVSTSVVHHAHCPVVVVPAPAA